EDGIRYFHVTGVQTCALPMTKMNMYKVLSLGLLLSFTGSNLHETHAKVNPISFEIQDPVKPIIENGQAQVVPAFDTPKEWIRHDLWVETEFDTDGDGKKDRMHVSVTRPYQTESGDLKLHVIFETSTLYSGTARMVIGLF